MSIIDPDLPVQTRGGCRVEIVVVLSIFEATSLGETIIAIVTDHNGDRSVETYPPDGRYFEKRHSEMDLVNVAATRTVARV